jgi:hypothetical protein
MSPFAEELRRQAAPILAEHPALTARWEDASCLLFPAAGPHGFEVRVAAGAHDVVVGCGPGGHEHFEGDPAQAVLGALGLARDLLSPDMRVRELLAGGRPCRRCMERLTADGRARSPRAGGEGLPRDVVAREAGAPAQGSEIEDARATLVLEPGEEGEPLLQEPALPPRRRRRGA